MTTAAEPAPPGKRLLGFLLEIRKTIVSLGCGICLGTFGFYFLSPAIFATVQNHLHQQLAFFTVAEPFVAHVKLALFVTLFLLMPWIVFCFWRAMARPFALSAKALAAFVFLLRHKRFAQVIHSLSQAFHSTCTLTHRSIQDQKETTCLLYLPP